MADLERLKLLRVPFDASKISKLPKPFSKDSPKGNCKECGGYHGLPALHLDYVGHAALTDRLLEVDPLWNWKPVSMVDGIPVIDKDGGMWIELTVCGVTRLGYGDSQGKTGGNATKERIGDALRNAAMRFGAALDLWHKGDLHDAQEEQGKVEKKTTATNATTGVWESLPIDEQTFLQDIASDTRQLIQAGDVEGAVRHVKNQNLTSEEQIALWTRFDSKERSAMKKVNEELKKVS